MTCVYCPFSDSEAGRQEEVSAGSRQPASGDSDERQRAEERWEDVMIRSYALLDRRRHTEHGLDLYHPPQTLTRSLDRL